MMTEPKRIAMWSGPRNISTAMMRSWGNRADTVVCDEPLYAHYLKETGFDHPGAAEVMAHHETDPEKVTAWLLGPIENARLAAEPAGRGIRGEVSIWFQKHMAHHLLPGMDLEWVGQLTNCFLIRSPREMITSLAKVISGPTVEQTGLPQQVELFEREQVRRGKSGGGVVPPVIDARNVLENPEGMLCALCERVGVAFDEAMLSWPPGPRDTDGVWAKHWYDAVNRSTGFMPYAPKDEATPEHLESVVAECERLYELLYAQRITVV